MLNQTKLCFGLLLVMILYACIGDDIIDDRVPAQLRITNPIDSLKSGDTYQLDYMYTNIIGVEESAEVDYTSSDESIATVSNTGLLTGVAGGDVTISLAADSEDGRLVATLPLNVGSVTVASSTERTGTVQTTSSYILQGGFRLYEDRADLKLAFDSNWKTTNALPGLYVYLTNNRNSNANAFEIGEVTVFDGAHEYTIPSGAGVNDYSHVLFYCKPFGIKVGDGAFDN